MTGADEATGATASGKPAAPSPDEVPLVDLRERGAADALTAACEEVGFVSVRGHGIDPALAHELRARIIELFSVDAERKDRYRITRDNYRGFIPLGFFTPNRGEHSGTAADLYEGFKLHWECPVDHEVRGACALYGSNRWPPGLEALRDAVEAYWQACDRLSERLLVLFARRLGISGGDLVDRHRWPLTNMTLLHYPAHTPNGHAGIHPHRDTNVLTIVHPDPVGGLEVRTRSGGWMAAEAPSDALVINIGEMLELWSGGRFVATPHRVVNRSGQERYSFPYFLVPRHDVIVEPLVEPVPGFGRSPMPVGDLSAEVWRTNWPDTAPSGDRFDLGTLDR